MKVLLFGANGQLGSDIVRLWDDPAVQLAGVTRLDADVTDADAVSALVRLHSPDVVMNTTAFHNLPVCEQDPETCFRVNVVGGRNIEDIVVDGDTVRFFTFDQHHADRRRCH